MTTLIGCERFAVRVEARLCRNVIDGYANGGLRQQRTRLSRSAVVLQRAKVQLFCSDVDLVALVGVKAARVAGGLDVTPAGLD